MPDAFIVHCRTLPVRGLFLLVEKCHTVGGFMRLCHLAMLFLVGIAAARTEEAPFGLRAKGLRGALAWTSFVGSDAQGVSGQLNVAAGGFVSFALARWGTARGIELWTELLYVRQTVEQEIRLGGGGYTLRYDLSSVQLPLAARVFTQLQNTVVTAHLGIAPAVRTSGKLEQKIPNSVPKALSASFASFDVGLIGGIGSQWQLRRSAQLFADVRFRLGFLPVLTQELRPPLRENEPIRQLRNFSAGVFVGVGF